MPFGNSYEYKEKPNSAGYIANVANFFGTQSTGARLANKWLKGYGKGQDVGNYGFLNPIRDFTAARMRDADRDSQAQKIGFADQAPLMERLKKLRQDQIGEQGGMALSAGLNNMIPAFMQMSEQGQGRLDNERYSAMRDAAGLNNGAYDLVQKQGWGSLVGGLVGTGLSAFSGGFGGALGAKAGKGLFG